jgi:hypothetical protein
MLLKLVDSLRQTIAHKDSVIEALALRPIPSPPETVSVHVLGDHPAFGFLIEPGKIVFGAVLALGTSWWIESRRRAQDDKRARRPLKIRVETETHLVLLALEGLVQSLLAPSITFPEESPQTALKDLRPLLESFDRIQDRLYLLRKPTIETGLGVWYRRLRITVEQASSADLIDSPPFSMVEGQPPPPPNQERANFRTRFIELQREGNRLLERIRNLD